MKPDRFFDLKAIEYWAVAIVLMMSLIVLVGWFLRVEALVRVFPGSTRMQFTAAVAFILSSLSLIFAFKNRILLAQIFAGLVLAMGSLTLLEYRFGMDFRFDDLVAPFEVTSVSHPGRMASNTAIALVLFGFTVLTFLLLKAKIVVGVLTSVSGILMALSAGVILGFFLNVASIETFKIGPMALPTATCIFFLSLAMIRLPEKLQRKPPRTLEIFVVSVGLAISIFIWQGLRNNETLAIQRAIEAAAFESEHDLFEALRSRQRALDRMASRFSVNHGQSYTGYDLDRKSYRRDFELHQLEKIDLNDRIDRGSLIEIAIKNAKFYRSPVITTINRENQFDLLFVTPIISAKGAFLGSLLALMPAKQAFTETFEGSNYAHHFLNQIFENERLIYSQGLHPAREDLNFQFVYSSPRLPKDWSLKVIPTAEFIKGSKSALPHFALAFGVALIALFLVTRHYHRQIRNKKIEIERREWQLKYFVEHSPAAVAILDLEMRYIAVSESWIRVYGLKCFRDELIGKSHYEVFKDLNPRWKEIHAQCLKGQSAKAEADYWKRADGSELWLYWETHPWYEVDGSIGGLFIFSEDITAIKQNELALRTSNEALSRSNVDLEQFAYIASHDLQEPLRKITMFSGLLGQKFEHVLDPEAKSFLEIVISGARRMRQLIDDLLLYSRMGRDECSPMPLLDANSVLHDVISDQSAEIQSSRAKVMIPSLPHLAMAKSDLYQLFSNLITNALKYRDKRRAPIITISAKLEGQDWIISVSDNGIGIEKEYWDDILKPFKRLHAQHHYPGTGIGLAICKKIVERYGGRIWLESEVGRGTTFYFSIADKTPSDQKYLPILNKALA